MKTGLIFGGIMFLLGVAGFIYCRINDNEEIREKHNSNLAFRRAFVTSIHHGKDFELLDNLNQLNDFPDDLFYDIKNIMKFKIATNYCAEGERSLEIAKSLYFSINAGLPDLKPPVQAELDKAIKGWNDAKKYIDQTKEMDDVNFNFSLNFLKGNIYFRLLQMADSNKAKDYFDKCLTSYKDALKFRHRDVNTIINIELLIKASQNMSSSEGEKKQSILNQAGIGNLKGN